MSNRFFKILIAALLLALVAMLTIDKCNSGKQQPQLNNDILLIDTISKTTK